MARSLGCLVAAAFIRLTISSDTPSDLQIDASGHVISQRVIDAAAATHAAQDMDGVGSWLEVVRKAKENMARTKNIAKLVRTEIRSHIPIELASAVGGGEEAKLQRQKMDKILLGLLESGQVDCSTVKEDPVTEKLCHILHGSNTQVAGKLERAVKGLSLRPKNANETEMEVSDPEENKHLTHLKAAMWDMWFCAKRAECDPMSTTDPKVKAAREQAFDALQAIHVHAKDKTAAGEAGDAPKAALLEETQTPVANSSKFASTTLDGILTPPNVTGKLWDSINMLDIDDVLEQDIGKITKDEDGNMKKLKKNMLILHECATMPDCPTKGKDCCTPNKPTQAIYIQARNDAYVAYHNIQHDDDLAKQAYLDLLGTIGSGKKKGYKPPAHPKHHKGHRPTKYPVGHPLHGTEHNSTNRTNQTVMVVKVPEPEEGDMLLYAIMTVTAIVVFAIGFLVFKTNQQDSASPDKTWDEGEGEGYGQY